LDFVAEEVDRAGVCHLQYHSLLPLPWQLLRNESKESKEKENTSGVAKAGQ
jgi:hypothetical protein